MDELNQDVGLRSLFESLFSSPEKDVLKKLQGLVTNIKWTPKAVTDLFDALKTRFESAPTYDRSHFSAWMLKKLHLIEINYITPNWTLKTGKTLLDLIRDQAVTEENLKKYLEEEKDKQLDEILDEIRREPLNQVDEELLAKVKDVVSSVDKRLPLHDDGSELSHLKTVLQEICQAVKSTVKYSPRLTQMVSWCLMALSKTGRLIQVGTGEGKSCIVAMFAAFQAKEGRTVDVMSSSEVLAMRDLDKWRPFFDKLKISTDCNIMRLEQDLKKCYECQVVYGTVEEFAGDWLRQHFHKLDIFGQRKFQCAIVDEVDSLMLDKGHHVVYLSSDMPALQHLHPLLALIWATANQYKKISSEITVGKKHLFPQILLENIESTQDFDKFKILQIAEDAGLLTKGSVNQIRRDSSLLTQKLSNVTILQLAKFFKTVEMRFPFCRFSLHCMKSGKVVELNNTPQTQDGEHKIVKLLLSSGGFCQYMYPDKASVLKAVEEEVKQAICFTSCEQSHDRHTCHIPSFFSKLVNSQLKVWIQNAFEAQTMTRNDEYVIEVHGIIPVDYSNTGVFENCMQWSDGLHQFLEMKHGFKMSPMTAITNFMSNVGLLQKYGNQIYGMSGTLGQKSETEALQEIYNGITTCRIPSFRRRKLFEVEGMVTSDEIEWIDKTSDAVIEQTSRTSFRGKRAALVICETINHVKAMKKALKTKGYNNKLYISNNADNQEILKKSLDAGDIIIATNLAGRGTDLQVSDSVKKAGGLFVVQTFLPKNARVEVQAFGRTARQGSPGSAQLIVCTKHLPEAMQLLLHLRELRSLLENMVEHLLCFTPLIQNRFSMLLRQYQNNSLQIPTMLTQTLLHSLTENSVAEIKVAVEIRDASVAENLSTYLTTVVPNIKNKEELFIHYLDAVDVYRSADDKPTASELSALNEFWGMWLITEYKDSDCIESMKRKLTEEVSSAKKKLSQKKSPLSNLHHYTAFGNERRRGEDLEGSIEMYTKAIQEDHCWAAIALYNRAFAKLTLHNGEQDHTCIAQALEDLQNALNSVQLYCEQTSITQFYYTQQSTALSRFDRQLAARHVVLQLFKSNITMAVKKLDRVSTFGGTVKVEESLFYFMAPAEVLLPVLVCGFESLFAVRSRNHLRILQLNSAPSLDIFNELKSLESLGLTHVYSLDTCFSIGGLFSKLLRKMVTT